jgi:hypothetical protein
LGLHKCGHCKGQFTVKVGTVFEASKVPLSKWLQTVYLMTSSKKGISAHQLHRTLEVTYKTAWFMCHRVREAMRSGDLAPFDSGGGVVEVDETFIGHDKTIKPRGQKKGRGAAHKFKVRRRGERRRVAVHEDALSVPAGLDDWNLDGRGRQRRSRPEPEGCTQAPEFRRLGAGRGIER